MATKIGDGFSTERAIVESFLDSLGALTPTEQITTAMLRAMLDERDELEEALTVAHSKTLRY